MTEIKFCTEFFKTFNFIEDAPIVLYGIGEKTKWILNQNKLLNIRGLMDKDFVGETIYDYEVLSHEAAIKCAKIIIIVANIPSCPIIYERISYFLDQGLKIYYVNGYEPSNEVSDFWIQHIHYQDVLEEIKQHAIISFDIFDTLLMRKVYSAEDIFYELDAYDQIRCIFKNYSFSQVRKRAERICYEKKSMSYNLYDIYREIALITGIDSHILNAVQQLEVEYEMKSIIPRKQMVELYNLCLEMKKKVILVSDMYLSKDFLIELLKKNGIETYDDIYVSSDIEKSKYVGDIWGHIDKRYKLTSILHIGDNVLSDVELPLTYGISTIHILNSRDLLRLFNYYLPIDQLNNMDKRILGVWMSRVLNNPFCFETGSYNVKDAKMFGYMFWGPIVWDYSLWLLSQCEKASVTNLLLLSRDGYIIDRGLKQIMKHVKGSKLNIIYFLTSRRAASVADFTSLDEISFALKYFNKIKTQTVGQMLNRVFGVSFNVEVPILNKYCYEVENEVILDWIAKNCIDEIYRISTEERECYLKYIKTLDIELSKDTACVNFVGRGITQRYVERILGVEMNGFYFGISEEVRNILPNNKNIIGRYGEYVEENLCDSFLIQNYLLGETVFTSLDEQLIKFNGRGEPIFNGDRRAESKNTIHQCHEGIMMFIDDMLERNTVDMTYLEMKMPEKILSLINSPTIFVENEIRSNLEFNDYYNVLQENRKIL